MNSPAGHWEKHTVNGCVLYYIALSNDNSTKKTLCYTLSSDLLSHLCLTPPPCYLFPACPTSCRSFILIIACIINSQQASTSLIKLSTCSDYVATWPFGNTWSCSVVFQDLYHPHIYASGRFCPPTGLGRVMESWSSSNTKLGLTSLNFSLCTFLHPCVVKPSNQLESTEGLVFFYVNVFSSSWTRLDMHSLNSI